MMFCQLEISKVLLQNQSRELMVLVSAAWWKEGVRESYVTIRTGGQVRWFALCASTHCVPMTTWWFLARRLGK